MRRRRLSASPAARLTLLGLLLLGATAVLLANPRHRAFYFGAGSPPGLPMCAEVTKGIPRIR